MVSVDFLTVPTLRFQVLYVFLVLSHTRRKVLHFNVTAAPSARRAEGAAGALRPVGRRSSCVRLFRSPHPQSTSSGTGTAFTAWRSSTAPRLWGWNRSESRPALPGSRLTLSG